MRDGRQGTTPDWIAAGLHDHKTGGGRPLGSHNATAHRFVIEDHDTYNQEAPAAVPRELASLTGSEEEGLELLIHGSPIGTSDSAGADDVAEDEHLLDYDSDCDTANRKPPLECDAGGK